MIQLTATASVMTADQVAAEKAERKAYCDAEHDYESYRRRFMARFETNKEPILFTTSAQDLYETFLANLPEQRQHYTCHCCKRFFEVFGGLVTVNADGTTKSLFWDEADAPPFFRDAARALRRAVVSANITGVFFSSDKAWGTPVTGQWTHFGVVPPPALVHTDRLKTPFQAAAVKLEDYKFVCRSLAQYPKAIVDQVVTMLEAEKLPNGEKVIGPATFLQELHVVRENLRGKARDNMIWLGVASASPGLIHSDLVRTLFDDLIAGKDFNAVMKAFLMKTHPLKYQRAQVAPTAGNIKRAEEIVEKLGLARSLERRFATLDDVEALWKPKPVVVPPKQPGVFSHLKPKEATISAPQLSLPASKITFDKFRRTVLGTADEIQFKAPSHGSFCAFTAAVHADAPPILQWDTEERRNTVAWYFWHNGSYATQWGLAGGAFYKVSAVCLKPNMWGPDPDAYSNHGNGVMFIIEQARESRNAGAAIFPNTVKSDLHEVRATIERFSNQGSLEGMEQGNACGYMMHGEAWGGQVRVRTGQTWLEYIIDRWD